MNVAEIIASLERAADSLTVLADSGAVESWRLGEAFDGVATALAALKAHPQATVEAKPKFKLPPLAARPKKEPSPRQTAFVCLRGNKTKPKAKPTRPTTYAHEPLGGWQGARDSAKTPVKCTVDYTYATNEEDHEQPCVIVECSECGHTEQSWGQGERSVRRCLVLMGQNCPEGADDNFYILERD